MERLRGELEEASNKNVSLSDELTELQAHREHLLDKVGVPPSHLCYQY